MKRIAFATFVAMGMAAGAIAQQSRQPVETPEGVDRTNQISFEKADKNNDGKVNREEGNDIAGFDFSRADTNSDLTLSRAEFDAAMARSTSRGDGDPGPRSGDRVAQVSFEAVDTNKNNKIDRDEAEDIPGLNFSSADVDDDASLSRQEFQTAMGNSTPRG
jgi:EF hand domain-containing protein